MSKMDYLNEEEEYFYEDESPFLLKKDEEDEDFQNGYSMQSLGLSERDFM